MTIRHRWYAVLSLLAVAVGMAFVPTTTSAFTSSITTTTNSVASNPYFTCQSVFTAFPQSATYFEYALNEASNANYAVDNSGVTSRRGTYSGSMTSSSATPIACSTSTGGAYVLNGSSSYVSTSTAVNNPTTFSLAVWFQTTDNQDLLIGFGGNQTGTSNQYDRLLYIDSAGMLAFTTYTNSAQTLLSPQSYNDGNWHYAVATFSPAGTAIYADGQLVASDATMSAAQNYTGYWRIGYGRTTYNSSYGNILSGLFGGLTGTTASYFKGKMRYAAAFNTALTAADIQAQYIAGR